MIVVTALGAIRDLQIGSPEGAIVNSQGREPLGPGRYGTGEPRRGGRSGCAESSAAPPGLSWHARHSSQGLTPLAIDCRPYRGYLWLTASTPIRQHPMNQPIAAQHRRFRESAQGNGQPLSAKSSVSPAEWFTKTGFVGVGRGHETKKAPPKVTGLEFRL